MVLLTSILSCGGGDSSGSGAQVGSGNQLTFSSIEWTTFPKSATVGIDSGHLDTPTSFPVADKYDISSQSESCQWNTSEKTITYTNITWCTIRVTVSKKGYATISKDFKVKPDLGTIQSITWGEFPNSATVGTPSGGLGEPVSVPAADEYAIAKKSGDCSWDDDNNTLSFTNTTECILTVSTTKTGYHPLSKDLT